FGSKQDLSSLRINSGAAARITPGSGKLLTTASLTIAGSGTLDISDNDVSTRTAASAIKQYLQSGYDAFGNADWSGHGITSSLAVANPIKYTIGYADPGDPSAQDAGVILPPSGSVQVHPTLTGDANLDDRVDFFDIAQLLGYKYNTHQPASYTDGDLNYDG